MTGGGKVLIRAAAREGGSEREIERRRSGRSKDGGAIDGSWPGRRIAHAFSQSQGSRTARCSLHCGGCPGKRSTRWRVGRAWRPRRHAAGLRSLRLEARRSVCRAEFAGEQMGKSRSHLLQISRSGPQAATFLTRPRASSSHRRRRRHSTGRQRTGSSTWHFEEGWRRSMANFLDAGRLTSPLPADGPMDGQSVTAHRWRYNGQMSGPWLVQRETF